MPDYRPTSTGTQLIGDASDKLSSLGDFLQKQGLAKANMQHDFDVQKQKSQLAKDEQTRNISTAQDIIDNQAKAGRNVKVKVGDVDIGQQEDNPLKYMYRNQAASAQQANHLQANLGKAYKPYEDQVNAANTTIDNLNAGTGQGDKMALINEAALATKGSGGRALGMVMQQLGADPTMLGNRQALENYFSKDGAGVKLTPEQRNALREVTFQRASQLEQNLDMEGRRQRIGAHSSASMVPPQDVEGIVGSYEAPALKGLSQFKQKHQDYLAQKQKQGNQLGTPGVSTQQPAGIGGWLKSLIPGMGPGPGAGSQPQPAPGVGGQRPIKTLRNTRTGETKQVYGDTGEDVPNGQ